MAVIDGRAAFPRIRRDLHAKGIGKLSAIIARYCFKDLTKRRTPEPALETVKHRYGACGRFIRGFKYQLHSGEPFCHCQKGLALFACTYN